LAIIAGVLALGMVGTATWAGHFGFRGGAVGGISVDAEGVVRNVNVDARNMLRQALLKETKKVPGDLNQPVERRMISLKGLNQAIEVAQRESLGQLPDEVKYLAGLQRVQHIVLVPEENDILLIGPAEGWKVDDNANIVGVTTGLPVVQLDDLLNAFRAVEDARREGISCSIEPTEEGLRNFQKYLNQIERQPFSPAIMKGMEQAMGQQQIKLTGIPKGSHFARVLVASDYHMKSIAMNLQKSPVNGLPGFLDLMSAKRTKLTNMMPRWWLACNYEPIQRSEDSLVWEIRGPGVKALTEDDVVGDNGALQATGKKNPVAQQWADLMTKHYEELSKKNPVFGELRNIMDLCVVAALIQQEGLLAKAGCSIPMITDPQSELKVMRFDTPKTLSTQCSFMKRANEYIVTASGGVQINSFEVASHVEVNAPLKELKEKAGAQGSKPWWWN